MPILQSTVCIRAAPGAGARNYRKPASGSMMALSRYGKRRRMNLSIDYRTVTFHTKSQVSTLVFLAHNTLYETYSKRKISHGSKS